jgi:hypothetical protein
MKIPKKIIDGPYEHFKKFITDGWSASHPHDSFFLDSEHVENVARPSSFFTMAGEQKNKIIGNEPNQKSNCLISPPIKSANYQDADSTPAASLLQKLGVDMI